MPARAIRPSAIAAAWAAGDKRVAFAAFVLLAAFYGLTAAGNLSETDDAYAFAYFTETRPLTDISDPRLMLYHMVLRAAYLGVSGLGLDLSGLVLMQGLSVVCAALCLVLLPRLLHRGFAMPPRAAAAATLILGLTYGYWRYAAEADVYVPALLLLVLVLHMLVEADDTADARWSAIMPAAALAGVAVLVYQPNVVPLFFAFPLLFLRRGRLAWLVAYGAIGAGIVAGGYVLGYLVSQDQPLGLATMVGFLSQRSEEFAIPPLSLRVVAVSVVKAGFALSHDLVSASWLFGWDGVVDWVRRIFPANIIDEEIYTARQAGGLLMVPLAVLPLLLAVLCAVIAVSFHGIAGRLRNRRLIVCLVWFGLYAAMVGRLNPAGIEAWIMPLLPLVIILGVLVVAPALEHRRGGVLLAALVVLLAAHNWTGGMALVQDPAGEYDLVKGAWVVRASTPGDLVVVTDNVGLGETLRYRSRAMVTVIRSSAVATAADVILAGTGQHEMVFTIGRGFRDRPLLDQLALVRSRGGRVIVFDEFFEPKAARFHGAQRRSLEQLRARAVVVHDHPQLGRTFAIPVR